MITIEERKTLAEEIVRIAKDAGKIVLNSKINEVMEKGDIANVVTDIDVKSQKFIIGECQKCLPESCFLAEEEGQHEIGDSFTWVIDPIDGTTNFMYDYHHSCISIALYYERKGVIGVIYNPYLDECFVGIEGCGSTCNGKEIHVSQHEFKEALVMVGTSPYNKSLADKTFNTMKELFLKARDIRRSGSAALDLCYLACGRIDAFYEQQLQPWDYGAGNIIVRNAGGVVESIIENAFDELKPTGIICSNGKCQKELCEVILEENA